jgi:hypothetical protein
MNRTSVWDDRPGEKDVSWLAGASSTIRLLLLLSAVSLATAAAQDRNPPPAPNPNQPPASGAAMQSLPAGLVARVELHGTAMGTAPYVAA